MRLALAALSLLSLLAAAPALAADGRALYLENCATCHGDDGRAATELGRKYKAEDFTGKGFARMSPAKARRIVENGIKNTKMKGWKDELKPDELEAVTAYVLGFQRKPTGQ